MPDTAIPESSRARPGSGGDRACLSPMPATVQVTTTSTVAAGVFAAGHLGELTQQVPFELVDAVIEQTRATQQRLRELPSRVGVYFLLTLGLFPALGYRKVWGKLVAGLRGLSVPCPSDKALRDLRRRLGPAPVKALFEVLAGPVAGPHTPGVRFGRFRTVAFDGCTSIKVADSDRNRAWLGKLRAALGVTGYPAVELMTLVETGTRALLGAVFGPPAVGETDYARRLLGLGPTPSARNRPRRWRTSRQIRVRASTDTRPSAARKASRRRKASMSLRPSTPGCSPRSGRVARRLSDRAARLTR